MKLSSLIRKMFVGDEWYIAYRENSSMETNIFTDKNQYKVFHPNKNFWCADPFIYETGDRTYIFCEVYDKKKEKGFIGVAALEDGKIQNLRKIIEQPYHMSYPCVFEHEGIYYMIPESGENGTVELYRAEEFPYKWTLDNVLLENKTTADATVLKNGDKLFIFIYIYLGNRKILNVYELNMEDRKLTLVDSVLDSNDSKRPAGNIINNSGQLVRPSQDCCIKYGESIFFNNIVEMSNGEYSEQLLSKLSTKNILLEDEINVKRIHTFNTSKNYTVIDVCKERLDLFRSCKVLRRRIRKIRLPKTKNMAYEVVNDGILN